MMNDSLTTIKIARLTLLSCMLTAISACSNSGSNGSSGGSNTDNGDVASLQIITPKTIYSKPGVAGSSYVVINNPTATAVKNIQYSLTNLTGGASGASVDPASAANCATVAAYSQCNVKVTVESGAVAGSLGLSISNDSSLLAKLSKSAKAATTVPTLGVEQAAYNTASGADGITLSYYNTVINGTPYVLVSGLVASSNAGTFNKIVLVNGSGTALPNQEVISPVSNTQGSTFNILLPVPSGSNATQTIKVQTQQQTAGQTTVVSTSASSSTLTTTQSVGIAEMLPSAVYLTEANPEQTVTFLNTGDAVAQLQQLVSNNPNVEVVFSPASLTSGATATATLKLKDKTVAATTGNITLTYNNGQSQTSSSDTVDQNVSPVPSPSPTPSPTPTPTPPGPTAGLTAVFNPNNNDFFTTTAIGTVSKQLTLTNTGNTPEDSIILALPPNFTISDGSSNSCTVTQTTISNTLTTSGSTKSCDVTVTYTNTTITPETSEDINIGYNYNNGTPATPTTAAVDYKVTQSTAVLALSPNTSQNYGSIVSNNTETSSAITYTVTNSGEVPATDLEFVFGGTNASLFGAISGSSCIASGALSNTSGSNTCTVDTQFGPAPNGSAGSKAANFKVDYTPYPSGITQSTAVVAVSGTVTAAPSATFSSTVTADADFTGGAGTQGDPYTGYTSTNYTVDVTYTNTSAIAATGFTTSYATPPTGWSMTTHGCNNTAMAASGTCTDIYTLNSASTGTTSINLGNVTASWSDSSGSSSNVSMPGDTVYADLSVPPVPAITITPVANWQTMMGSAFAFTATIANGSSTVTPTTDIPGNTVLPASCSLNSAVSGSESGVFIITDYTGSGNYSYWDPANVANSTDVNTPADAFTPISGISLDVSATNSATINGNASPHIFNSITGTVIAPYVYLAAPEVGAATTTNTGITWGTGGTVATRFEAGTQNGGGSCSDSQKDNLTGLEWAKNGIIGFEATEGGGPIAQPDYANTTANLNILPWSDAATAINNMNTAATKLCGYSDWRLPTVNELLGLVNYKATQNSSTPAAWLNSNGFNNVQTNDDYWSATSYGSSNAWRVLFNDGSSGNMSTSNINYVWPVRGGQ